MIMILKAFGVMLAIIVISIIAAGISAIYRGRNDIFMREETNVFSGKLENTDTSIKEAIKYLELTNRYAGQNRHL